jgi:hypothetical protein
MTTTTAVIGLVLALYNANTTTDWVRVAHAAQSGVPIRAILPVHGVVPPDPNWAPVYPADPSAYRTGVELLKSSGVEVYAYTHLRNLSMDCCTCCGNLTQFQEWLDVIKSTATFDGVMLDNNDSPWSAPDENKKGLESMYLPAARMVQQAGLGVWANGPHVSKTGHINANATEWHKYLEYSNFTTLFEMSMDDWENFYPPNVNFSERLQWPSEKLGGYILDIPDEPAKAATAIETSLTMAVTRGLKWLYPTITCQHRTGSCTYAHLPTYWDVLISTIQRINSKTEKEGALVVAESE